MRKIRSSIAIGGLVLALAFAAFGQNGTPATANPSQNPGQRPASAAPAASASAFPPQTDASLQVQDPQPQASLGEHARLAHAKKSGEPAALRIPNNENMGQALFTAGRGGAPAISLVGGDGSGSSSSSAGHLTLLDFWATWCGPCRHALPGLKQFISAYGDQVDVISISEDRDKAAWSTFVDQNQMSWPQQFDSNRTMAKLYGVTAFPTYILIDGSGHVVQQFVGDDPSMPLGDRIGPELRNALAGKS